jgi:hypothetical protein
MKKIYKTISLALMLCISAILLRAQEVPLPPKAPEQSPVSPALPGPPKFDEQAWKDWVENFKKSFDEKKWQEWGQKFEKSFKGFDKQFENMDLASADFKEKMEKLNKKLKDIKIPEISALPEMPALTAMPEIIIVPEATINHRWVLGALEGAVEKIKKLTKSYSVDTNDQLAISSSYGKITINTWDKNEIKVDVEIKAYAQDDHSAQDLLDKVTISNSKSDNMISFKTNINNNEGKSWFSMNFWGNNSDKEKVEIYYTVYMPANNALQLKTNYTNNTIPDMSGAVSLNMNYGDLQAGKLSGPTNKIGSNYFKMDIQTLNNAYLNCNYGSLKINNAKNLNANCNYSAVNLTSLSDVNSIKMNYGDFKLNKLAQDFKTLSLNCNYSQTSITLNNFAVNFDITTLYANFKYDDSQVIITIKSTSDEGKGRSSAKSYKGYFGKSPTGNIIIKSNYGGVKFD